MHVCTAWPFATKAFRHFRIVAHTPGRCKHLLHATPYIYLVINLTGTRIEGFRSGVGVLVMNKQDPKYQPRPDRVR